MKVVAETRLLRQALAAATHVAPRKNDIPILNNVRLVATGDRLTVTANDLARELTIGLAGGVETAGDITAPAHPLAAFFDGLPEGSESTLALDGALLKLTSGRREAALPTLPAVDFPVPSFDPEGAAAGTLTGGDLDLLERLGGLTEPVGSSRAYLSGVHLRMFDGALWGEASNGHIAGRFRLDGALDRETSEILPVDTLQLAKRVFAAGCSATLTPQKLRLTQEDGGAAIVSALVEGTFPDLQRVIPGRGGFVFTCEPKPLAAAVKAVAKIAADDRMRAVRLTAGEAGLTLCCPAADGKSASERLDVEIVETAHGEFAVQTGLLTEVLDALAAETVTFSQAGLGEPVLIEPVGVEHRRAVIMPVRL